MTDYDEDKRPRSNWWFALPIFLGIVGGIIAYFVLRNDDPGKAKNCLYLGMALALVGIVMNILFTPQIDEFGQDLGIDINV